MHSTHISADLRKNEKYELLLQQTQALLTENANSVALLANCISALHFTFQFHWTGIYLVIGERLELSVFQGPVACTSIGFGKGVCGSSWKQNNTIIVDDVDSFEGHIACSSLSKSEIVVPIVDEQKKVIAVLDIDSEKFANFDTIDQRYLEQFVNMISLQTKIVQSKL